jgi:HNH endonuclease
MKCVFCTNERPPSLEHVFPLAIGGHVTTDRVCKECNSTLGSRVDAALCEFLPIRIRRAELGLVGNSRTPPGLFDLLTGDVTLVNEPGGRLRTTYNEITKKLEHTLAGAHFICALQTASEGKAYSERATSSPLDRG